MRRLPLVVGVASAVVGACKSEPPTSSPSSTASSAAAAAVPTVARSASAAPSALEVAAGGVASARPTEEAPLAIDDPKAPRDRVKGTIVFTTATGEDPVGLYELTLDGTASMKPRRLAIATDAAGALTNANLDPTGKTVVYVKEVTQATGQRRDELWTVPLAGGTPVRIGRCTDSCRSPAMLADGRVTYVDHGPGLTQATVRFVKAGASPDGAYTSSVFFGGSKELATCSITMEVDRRGANILVNVNNELGWPECNTDASWLFRANELTPRKLERPPATRGTCAAAFGDDDRIYVGGYECEPAGSFGADGDRPTFPDAAVVGGVPPRKQWSVEAREPGLVAVPPTGDRSPSFVVLEARVSGFVFRRQ